LSPATITDTRGHQERVAAGDMMLVPKGGVRNITAGSEALRAVLLLSPGGDEGTARAGALPTPEAPRSGPSSAAAPRPILARASGAQQYPRPGGTVLLVLDPARTKRGEIAASLLTLEAGATVPQHQHATETELLYILDGTGTLTVGGVTLPVQPTSVLQLRPAIPHGFVASTRLRAIQFYTPAGPEQRFKAPL
jgi:quercetin dioxygenase-like cupin family protein